MAKNLSIGDLARRTGVNIETIRYYEKQKILPAPMRSLSNRRLYDEQDVKRLGFVHRCRQLGFTLKEIVSLLSLVNDGDYTCGEVHALTTEHAGEISRKIADLRKIQKVLDEMTAKCKRGQVPDCPIVDSLYHDA